MTWPSFFAASISAGVTGSGGGASAMTRVENAAPASKAPVPVNTLRRDSLGGVIGSLNSHVLAQIVRMFWARYRTPKIVFYSYSVRLVYRRQLVPIAARLGRQDLASQI